MPLFLFFWFISHMNLLSSGVVIHSTVVRLTSHPELVSGSTHMQVYIMTNKIKGTLYVGVTRDLAKRVMEHKDKLVKGFTKKYGLDRLVYYEDVEDYESAIAREKQIKNWHRGWKIELIESINPFWKDLYNGLI